MLHDFLQIYLPLFSIFFATLCCVFICYHDVTKYRIPNPIVVAIAVAALGVLLPTAGLTTLLIQGGMGLIFLLLGFALYFFKIMGAGDSKLFAALGLWCPPHLVMFFLLIVAFAGLAVSLGYAAMHFKKMMALKENSNLADMLHVKVPYGLALSAGGLFLFFQAWKNLFLI